MTDQSLVSAQGSSPTKEETRKRCFEAVSNRLSKARKISSQQSTRIQAGKPETKSSTSEPASVVHPKEEGVKHNGSNPLTRIQAGKPETQVPTPEPPSRVYQNEGETHHTGFSIYKSVISTSTQFRGIIVGASNEEDFEDESEPEDDEDEDPFLESLISTY